MYLIYIDESGNTGARKDPNQPIHLIGAMMVECEKVRTLEDEIAEIAETHFPELSLKDGFELHAADMFNGAGMFRGVPAATRVEVVEKIINLTDKHDIRLGWAAIDKMKLRKEMHPHQLAFVLLIERLETFLQQRERLGLIVADENKEVEQSLIDDLSIYKRHRTNFGYRAVAVKTIVDSVHFVQSRNNLLIQCIDVITYFILRGFRTNATLLSKYVVEMPGIPYPRWIDETASRKDQTLMRLYRQIQKQISFSKIFPE